MPKKRKPPPSSFFFDTFTPPPPATNSDKPYLSSDTTPSQTAIIYCEGHFGKVDGKTANGLVRHSEKYRILSIIDSEKAGQDAGEILDGKRNGIPICRDLDAALADAGDVPDYFIFGIDPTSGMLSPIEKQLLLQAIEQGMNIVNDDPEFAAACAKSEVIIRDVRKPRDK